MAQRETRTPEAHGGALVAEVLARHDVRFLFTLCGGHISPILLGCEAQGIRVIDVRMRRRRCLPPTRWRG
jgi:hypothetical protein